MGSSLKDIQNLDACGRLRVYTSFRSQMTGRARARSSGGGPDERLPPPPPPPRDRERKPKKEPTAAKAAEQLFKKVTLKISEAEGLEQAMRKGGMRLGFEIYRSPTIAATPFRFTNTHIITDLLERGGG